MTIYGNLNLVTILTIVLFVVDAAFNTKLVVVPSPVNC